MNHEPQLLDEAGLFFAREKSPDFEPLITSLDGDVVVVPDGVGVFNAKACKKPHETVDAFRLAMTRFHDQFVDREREHLLGMRASDAHIQAREQYAHLERGEWQYEPEAAQREGRGDRGRDRHQRGNKIDVRSPGPGAVGAQDDPADSCALVEVRRDHNSTALRLREARRKPLRVGAVECQCRKIPQQRMRKRQFFEAECTADPLRVAITRVVA